MDNQELQSLKNNFDIVGNDSVLNDALERAVKIAPTDIVVLITGESGVGKENIPKIIHQYSRRRNGKYLAVNCGAIPEGTVDSELFGHEKGSFTGATESRKGYFEEANGGTLFLDEIGELPLASQARLLRVLQNGEYIKVGSSKVEKTDVRVVAATNVNLEYAVAQGKFRQDLYYRLSGFMIYMPPLRDRKEDISLLFRKFASDFSEKYGMKKVNLTNDATRLLISYRWPGNVRQLKSVAENVSVLETSGPVNPSSGRIEVNAEMLAKHLPKENPEDMLPAKVERPGSDAFSSSEKQAIVNAIVELKKDVELLKAQIKGNVQVPDVPTAVLNHLNDDADWQGQGMPVTKDDISKAPVIDIPVEPEEQMPQSSTIKELSNELMRQRLEANHGNRKLTAQQLGISERTLYRRLPPEYKNQRKPNK